MEHSDIPVFIGKAKGNDNQPVTIKITSINFARQITQTLALPALQINL